MQELLAIAAGTEVDVTLASETKTIQFTESHPADIKASLTSSDLEDEQQVKDALEKQGFFVSDVKRIEQKEFDVVATKDCVIYNVQCKNNLVDITRMEENPCLFARYNRRLDRYYADALRKEEGREGLLKQRFGLGVVKHVVLSKFPIATKNPRILAFREISQFGKQFAS